MLIGAIVDCADGLSYASDVVDKTYFSMLHSLR